MLKTDLMRLNHELFSFFFIWNVRQTVMAYPLELNRWMGCMEFDTIYFK